jgi:hypothetical protein
MSYVLPQVELYQLFTQLPTAITDPLRSFITGGNAELFRCSDSDEKALVALGAYDFDTDTDYLYPNRPTGGIVDQGYFKLCADNVLLQYFEDLIGADSTIIQVAATKNKIISDAVNWAENISHSITYARDSALEERDVQVGDVIDIRGVVLTVPYTLRSTVKDIEGNIVADVIEATTVDAGNQAADTLEVSITKTAGDDNCISATANGTTYDGSVEGDITETYTVTVTAGSVGDDHTTGRLRVRSASGNDDADDVVPSAVGVATAIGTRGLTVTFGENEHSSCSSAADDASVSQDDLLAGQEWTVVVSQLYFLPVGTSAGDYTGDDDTTYIVEVTRGGEFTNTLKPQISVSTTTGVDVSGPTDVTADTTAIVVGSKGVTISFAGSSVDRLCDGDIYYITVTAEYEGNMRILVLNHSLPVELIDATDLDVTLYIPKDDIEIARKRAGSAPSVNYTLGDPGILDTGFTVEPGITLFDASWVNSSGDQIALPMVEADLFSEYRAWLPDMASTVHTISDTAELDDIPGALHPDNELKWAIFLSLQNANGSEVKYTAVANPNDNDSWIDVIELIVGRTDVYGIVPLTTDTTILGLFAAHVDAQSTPQAGRWRSMWLQLVAESTVAVVDETTSTDEGVILATIEDDPTVDGDQFIIVNVPADNGEFITDGVRPGDIMRYSFDDDGWGDSIYDEYVVDQVITEGTLRLTSGPDAAVGVAKKMEIYRNLNATALAAQLATKAGNYASRRVKAVWPDTVGSGGTTFAGYHLCAALAGLRSGSPPNQGLTNVEISGIDEVDRTVDLFNKTQLDAMALGGVWIVTQVNPIVTRHELTTAGFGDLLTQEEMVTSNVDSMSFLFQSRVEDLIGRANVTPGTIDIIENRIMGIIEFFKEVRVESLGGQLIDGEIISIRQHTILKDRIVVELVLTVPVPMNTLELHLNIVA